ncbi:hypothetical protein H4S08_002278 [Coemansia sp. RSA 1365]|nr:hypothetical protein H4S08_002278 [Coemansia sp. RSA 1365]
MNSRQRSIQKILYISRPRIPDPGAQHPFITQRRRGKLASMRVDLQLQRSYDLLGTRAPRKGPSEWEQECSHQRDLDRLWPGCTSGGQAHPSPCPGLHGIKELV